MTQQKASVGEPVLPNTVNTVPPTTPSEHSDTEHLFPTTSPLLSQGNIILQTPERVSYGSSSSSKDLTWRDCFKAGELTLKYATQIKVDQ